MARVTIEDCLKKVQDRFELVVLASERAKKLESGSPALILLEKKEKPAIIALREIAAGAVDINSLKESVVLVNQKIKPSFEDIDEEDLEEEILSENEVEIE
ncbi:MAG: DNA-directed RNA polymerase subunit omega [Alphaproteobacteria bacterium]|jgi:DNA-directed RNA polymerase subunit omega